MQAIMPITQANMDVIAGSGSEPGQLGIERLFADNKELDFRAAYRVTGNSSDAEDVLQTVFLRLLRSPQPPEIHHLRAYLHRAAVNAALDLLRSMESRQDVPAGAKFETFVFVDRVLGLELGREIGRVGRTHCVGQLLASKRLGKIATST